MGAAEGIRPREVQVLLAPFGVALSELQQDEVVRYVHLLLRWNRTLNLTSVSDPEEIVLRHFGESMFLRNVAPVENCRLADIGTGAGFPGLAIKIACPSIHVTLIESNQRKCAFLAEVSRELDLEGVEIIARRYEEMRVTPSSFDVVVSRAIGKLLPVLKWARTALASSGYLALWLGGQDATKISKTAGWNWDYPRRIPDSQRRFILIGRRPKQG